MRTALPLVVLVALLVGGPAHGQGHFKEAVDIVLRTSPSTEIVHVVSGQVQKTASVGRYVRWGGSILIGSALVAAGLDYFYNYLKRETGTSLDQWYHWTGVQVAAGTGNYSTWVDGPWCSSPNGCKSWELSYRCGYGWRVALYVGSRPGGFVGWNGSAYGPWVQGQAPTCDVSVARQYAEGDARQYVPEPWRSDGQLVQVRPDHVSGVPEASRSRFQSDLSWLRDVLVVFQERPPLADWVQQHPDAAEGVRTAVRQYVQDHEPSSPAAPYPGVQLVPVPNPNQWTDNPFTRPDLDTDGDGWPDSVEWKEANRRGVPWTDVINDPQVHPDPSADADGDGWPNLEELRQGTDPYDATSRPRTGENPATRSPDTDGDGWPDSVEIGQGTDPNDPASHPEGEPPQQEQNPDEPQWPGGPGVPPMPEVQTPEVPQEERKELPRYEEAWQQARERILEQVRDKARELRTEAAERFPFGIVKILSARVEPGTAACGVSVPIAEWRAEINLCETPVCRHSAPLVPWP
ncbi:hypothetical protein TbrSNM41_05050 [Thermus brockianus]|uniref:Uncharacterized protein n=1 Tax=Thermus brockianus TaxID=56956 RepID=A0ABM7XHL6_THEBO|nr:hypothetical protein TbrSNM41_05050 [Thermus brockianus]